MKIKTLKEMIGNQPDDADVDFLEVYPVSTKLYLKLVIMVLWLI